MSNVVDERVASMSFDNKDFEKNVETSLNTIEKLKKSFNFDSASKGLDSLQDNIKKVDVSSIGDKVDAVRIKFSMLDHFTFGVMQDITRNAIATGKKIFNALFIDPRKTGLQEYETQIGAIQTILANTESKGSTLSDVNRALNELNHYADMTIYNFTEMTRNIGTFTAAGVDLDTSVAAIKGIANLAAVSGSTSQQASTAMYQLSQALSSGTVKLMDWNSVVNAGMGGQVFQDALKETARVHGIAIDDMIEKQGSFRETLSSGWLSSEVLLETLKKMTGDLTDAELKSMGYTDDQIKAIQQLGQTASDAATKVKTFTQLKDTIMETAQSGWTQTWEIIMGDFDEAKQLWSSVSDELGAVLGASAEKRNFLLSHALDSNWKKMVERINDAGISTEDFETKVKEVAKQHGIEIDKVIAKEGSLRQAFQNGTLNAGLLRMAIDKLNGAGSGMVEVTEGLELGSKGEEVKKLQKTLLDLGMDLGKFGADGEFGKVTQEAIKKFQELNGLEITGIVDEATVAKIKDATSATSKLGSDVYLLLNRVTELGGREMIIESFKNIWEAVGRVVTPLKDAFDRAFGALDPQRITGIISKFKEFTESLKISDRTANNLRKFFYGIFNVLKTFGSIVGSVFKAAYGVVKDFIGLIDAEGLMGILGKIGDWLSGLAGKVDTNKINDALKGFGSLLTKGASSLKKWFTTNVLGNEKVQAVWNKLKTTMVSIFDKLKARFSDFAKAVKALDGGFSLKNITQILKAFVDKVIKPFFKMDIGEGFKNFKDSIVNFFKGLKSPFASGSKLFSGIKERFSDFSDFVKKAAETFKKSGITFESVKNIVKSFIDYVSEKVPIAIDILNGFAIFKLIKGIRKAFEAIGPIGESLVKTVSDITGSVGSVVKSFAGIFDALSDVIKGYASKINAQAYKTKSEGIKNIALSIFIIAGAIALIGFSIKKLGEMDPKTLKQGGIVAGAILGALLGFVVIVSKSTKELGSFNAVALGAMMKAFGKALLMFAAVIWILGSMKTKTVVQGGLAVLGIIGLLTLVMKASKGITSDPKALVNFGKMIKSFGKALLIMTIAIAILGKMKTSTLIKGGLAMTAMLGLILLMGKISKASGGDAASLTAFGKMMKSIGVSLLLMSASIAILGGLKTKNLIQGLSAMTVLLGIVEIMMVTSKLAGDGASLAGFGKMMKSIGVSLLLMSASIAVLGSMDAGNLLQGMSAIITLLGLIEIMMLTSKLAGKDASKFGAAMSGMGLALLLMTAPIAILGKMKTENLVKGIVAVSTLTLVMLGLIALFKIVTKDVKSVVKIGGTLFALAGSLLLLAGVVVILGTMNKDKLLQAAACLGILGLTISAFMIATKFVNAKAIGVILTMSLMLALIASSLYMLASIPDTSKLETAANGLVKALLAMSAVMAVCALIGLAGPAALIGVAVLAGIIAVLAGAIAIAINSLPAIGKKLGEFFDAIAPSLKGLTELKDNSILDGVKTLAEVMLTLTKAGFEDAKTKLFGGNTSSFLNSFLEFVKQILPVMNRFAKELSAEGLTLNVTNINTVMDAIKTLTDIATNAPKNIRTTVGMGTIYAHSVITDLDGFVSFIKEVVPIVKGLATDVSGVKLNTGNLKAVTTAVSDLCAAASSAPRYEEYKNVLGTKKVSYSDIEGIANFIKQIAPVVKGMAVEVSDVKLNTKNVEAVATAAKDLADAGSKAPTREEYSNILGTEYVTYSDIDKIATFIQNVAPSIKDFAVDLSGDVKVKSDTVKGVAEAAKILAEAGALAPTYEYSKNLTSKFVSYSEIDAIAKFIKDVAPIVSGFSIEVSENKINKENVESVANAAKILAEAASLAPTTTSTGFLGGAVTFVEAANIGAVSQFITDVAPYVKGFAIDISGADVNPEKVTAVAEAANSFANAAAILPTDGSALSRAFVGATDYEGVIKFIKDVSDYFKENFVNVTKPEISTDTITAIADATNVLAEASNKVPKKGSIIKDPFVGVEDYDGFNTFISETVPAIIDIFKGAKIEGNNLESVANDVTVLAGSLKEIGLAANTIPKANGLKQEWAGVADYQSFMDFLVGTDGNGGLLDTMAEFTSGLNGKKYEFDTSAVTSVSLAAKSLGEMAALIPKSGGAFDWLSSSTDWDSFNTNIVKFGESMVTFSNTVSGKIDNTTLTAASYVGEKLSEMLTSLAIHSLQMNAFDWDEFNTQLGLFGNAMVEFSNNLVGLDPETTTIAADALYNIGSAFTALSSFDYESIDVGAFQSKLFELSNAIKNFAKDLEGSNAVEAAKTATDFMKEISKASTGEFSGADDAVKSMKSMGTELSKGFTSAFSESSAQVESAASGMISEFVNGLNSGVNDVKMAAQFIVGTAVANMKSDGFAGKGKDAVIGFANGLGDVPSLLKVKMKAKLVAEAAIKKMQEVLDSHSPSRVTYKLGTYTGEGFANGMNDFQSKAARAGGQLANAAKTGLSKAISRINDLVSGEMQTQPTIRPVVDLTDVRNSAGLVNSMFNGTPAFGFSSNIGTISTMMNSRQNGNPNADVVSAIRDLSRKVEEAPRDVYNVNGITYDDGSNITNAVKEIVRAVKIERRI